MADKELIQMTKTNPPLPSLSRPTSAETLATPYSVCPFFSPLEQFLIKVKRYESSGAIAAIFCF